MWLYNNDNRSVLLVALLYSTSNNMFTRGRLSYRPDRGQPAEAAPQGGTPLADQHRFSGGKKRPRKGDHE